MDPLSIATGCAALIGTIAKLSISISDFVKSARAARGDLDAISRELASLKTLLGLLEEDAQDDSAFPEALRNNISGMVSNCFGVLAEIETLLKEYNAPGTAKSVKWAIDGSKDARKLRVSLETHKSALELALQMVSMSLTKDIKADTAELRHDTTAIKQDTTQILEEIARLQARLPEHMSPSNFPDLGSTAPDSMLNRYLDGLTTYTETVVWSDCDSETNYDPEREPAKDSTKQRPDPLSDEPLVKVDITRRSLKKRTSPRIKWSFVKGNHSGRIIKRAPVLTVRLVFLPAAVVSTANRLEQTDSTTSHSTDQMTSLWRVTTVSALLKTSAFDPDFTINNLDLTIYLAERARARLASASIFPTGVIRNILRGRLKNAVTIDSDEIRIFRDRQDLGEYDMHSFLIEIDATSMAKLNTHCQDIYQQHLRAVGSISCNDAMEMVILMMKDIRALCYRSPILFQMSARKLIVESNYIRYGVNDGHQFITITTSVGFREMITLFITLSDVLGLKEGEFAERICQTLILLLSFLTNHDLKTVQALIESRYRFKADRASLELLFLMVYDEIISQRV